MKTKMILRHVQIAIGILTILVSVSGGYAMAPDDTKGQGEMTAPELISEQTPQYVPGEILVKFKEGADPSSILKEADVETQGFERVHSIKPAVTKFRKDYKIEKDSKGGWYSFLGKQYKEVSDIPDEEMFKEAYKTMPEVEKSLYRSYKVKLSEGISVEEAVSKLKDNPNVQYAQPNYKYELMLVPNDPYYSTHGSWGQSYDDLWGIKKLQCQQAWDISQGEGIVVAVIDSGVDYNHEDLAANIWTNPGEIPDNGIDDDGNGFVDDIRGYDFSDNDADPADYFGHGTHCAGTIAAVGNNGLGVIGVAPRAKIMPVKIFPCVNSDICAQAIRYAASNGAKVLSNSWGPKERCPSDPEIEAAIDDAHDQYNCVVVFAAGNSNDDAAYYYPQNYSKTITVAATDYTDTKASFSNYGTKITVAAPGVDILSLRAAGTDMYINGRHFVPQGDTNAKYYTSTGTSMACPHIAGVAALILSSHPGYTPEQVKAIIKSATTDNITSGEYIGKGIANAYYALSMTEPPDCIACITSPAYGYLAKNGIFPILGSATGVNYRVSFSDEGPYSDEETEIAAGNGVENGLLASFDASALPMGGYFVKLRATDIHGYEITDTVKLLLDPTFLHGWPVSDSSVGISSPIVADINLDGKDEIIYNTNSSLLAYKNDGTTLFDLSIYSQIRIRYNVAVGDLDPDFPGLEMAAVDTLGGKRLLVLHPDHTYVAGSTALLNSSVYIPIIADFDGDGQDEVLFSLANCKEGTPDAANGGPRLYLYKKGTILAQQPCIVNFNGYRYTGASAADIDMAGGYEILAAVSSLEGQTPEYGFIRVYNSNGEELGWARMEITGAYFINAPVTGDLDSDGNIEVIAATSNNKVYMWSINGTAQTVTLLPNWPKDLSGDGMPELVDNISLADVDTDGNVEITAMHAWKVYIWTKNGDDYAGFPKLWHSSTIPLIIGDIDGDRRLELLNASVMYGTNAYKLDGSEVNGFPKFNYDPRYLNIRAPALGDVNGDGALDFVIGNSLQEKTGVFTLGQSGTVEWPMCYHDAQNTNNYNYKRGILPDHTPPAAPVVTDEGVRTFNTDRLTASWAASDPESGILEYLYAIGTTQGGTDIKGWTSTGNSASVTATGLNLVSGQKYFFSVKAKNGIKMCSAPGYSDGIRMFTIPAAPTGLYAGPVSTTQVRLNWQDNSSDEFGFHIEYRRSTSPTWTLRTVPIPDTTTYTCGGLSGDGLYYFRVKAYNPAGLSGYSNTVTAVPIPTPPAPPDVSAIPSALTKNEGSTITKAEIKLATDPNGDTLTYTYSNWFTSLPYTIGYDKAGTHTLHVEVSDGATSVGKDITITVNNINPPPNVSAIPGALTKNEGDTITKAEIELATDPDGGTLTYTYSNWFTTLPYTIGYNESGTHTLHVEVSDGTASVYKDIAITVNNVNRPPDISAIPGALTKDEGAIITKAEIELATDPDGDTLPYPDGGTLTYTYSNWFTSLPHTIGYDESGAHTLHVEVSDGATTVGKDITITVNNVNRPPDVSAIPGALTKNEGAIITKAEIELATDPDGGTLTYTYSNWFTSLPHTIGYDESGAHTLHVEVSDGATSVEKDIAITVNNTNRPPILDPIGNKTANENQQLTFTVSATDPDGSPLTFLASNLPGGATFDTATQTFRWTPTYDQAGTYNKVHFEATDGSLTDSEDITITVNNTDRPPVLNPIGNNKSTNENQQLTFTISATDPDGGPLTYSASNLPKGATFNPATRIFSWKPYFNQAGTYDNIHFEVTDGSLTASENITITVNNVNRAPVLNLIGNKSVTIGNQLNFTISATDLDGGPLTYSASNLPPGASFSPLMKQFSWYPTSTQAGTYNNVHFQVSDGELTDSKDITIVVIKPNNPPVLNPIGNKQVNEGALLKFYVSAKDPNGDTLYFGADNLPKGATFMPVKMTNTYEFSWKPDYTQSGKYRVTLWVTDVKPGSPNADKRKVSEIITITVKDVPKPTIGRK